MIDGYARRVLPHLSNSLIRLYSYFRLTPNHLTISAFLLSLVCCYAIVNHHFNLAIIIWWTGRLLDGTDGIYARATKQTSFFGAHIDILSDMAAYSVVILALNYVFPEFQIYWITILFFYVLCITGALSLGILEQEKGVQSNDNRGLRLGAGLAEGGETGIAYTVFLAFPHWMSYSLWAWLSILAITVVARLILAGYTLRAR